GVVTHFHAVEEYLREAFVTVESTEPTHRHAVCVQRHEKVRQSLVARGVRIASKKTEEVGAERAPSSPCLLAGQPPTRFGPFGLARNCGQVAACTRLGP